MSSVLKLPEREAPDGYFSDLESKKLLADSELVRSTDWREGAEQELLLSIVSTEESSLAAVTTWSVKYQAGLLP